MARSYCRPLSNPNFKHSQVDASVLVALFTDDALAIRADGFLRTRSPVVIVSDFAAAQFASAIARHVPSSHVVSPQFGAKRLCAGRAQLVSE